MAPTHLPKTQSLDKIARAYSSQPWWYDVRGFLILTFAYRSTLWEQMRLFGNDIGPYHLEAAIGTGTLFDIILKWRKWKQLPSVKTVGFDYAAPMLAGAMKRFSGISDIELKHADVADLPYENNVFDSANIANAIHCFPDLDVGLQELLRVLKPGARLAANVLLYPRGPQPLRWIARRINEWGMRKGILFSPYEPDDIRNRLSAAGFEIVRESISGNTYNVIARKPE